MDQLCRLLFHISPTCRAQDEKIFSEGSRHLSVSGRKKKKNIRFDLEGKVTVPFVRLLSVSAAQSRGGGGKH